MPGFGDDYMAGEFSGLGRSPGRAALPMSPPRPVTADTMSSAQRMFVGLQGITGVLPFLMQSTRQGDLVPSATDPAGAPKSASSVGSAGGTGSRVASKTTVAPSTTTPAQESSRSSENNQLVQTLLAKMFGEDEDDDLKGLRGELTRERLRMQLKREQMEHRAEMRRMQAQKRAEDLARREQDRVRGQAHRERMMANGPGKRGKIEVDESLVKRAAPEQRPTRAQRRDAYFAGVEADKKKRHMKNLGIGTEESFDYVDPNAPASAFERELARARAEEARARGRAKFEESL